MDPEELEFETPASCAGVPEDLVVDAEPAVIEF
jgi:hypothetical protein